METNNYPSGSPSQFSSTYPSQQSTHYPLKDQLLRNWFVLILGVVFCLAAIIFSFIKGFDIVATVETYGRAVVIRELPWLMVALFLFLPAGIILVVHSRSNWNNSLTIEKDGLALHKGIKRIPWVWANTTRLDIRMIQMKFAGAIIGERYRIILEDSQGHRLTLRNEYERMDQYIDQIRSSVLPSLLRRLHQSLLAAEKISFHKNITATQGGLAIKNQIVPWFDLQRPAIKNGKMIFSRRSNPKELGKVTINKVKNLDGLFTLLENPPINPNQPSAR